MGRHNRAADLGAHIFCFVGRITDSLWPFFLLRTKDYEAKLGYHVFSKWLEIDPATKVPLKIDQSDIDKNSKHYQYLAKTYFDMLEVTINSLGPDLADDLFDLGKRHATFGVKPPYFYTLGEATFYGLKTVMGDNMTKDEMKAWEAVYKYLADNMVIGCKAGMEEMEKRRQ